MFPTAILSQEYGLNFKGQSYLLDERTGLEISPNKYVDVKNEFEVSFDLKVDFKNHYHPKQHTIPTLPFIILM